MKAVRCFTALLALGAFGVMPATAADGLDRHGCRYRRQYETDCSNDIIETFNDNGDEPVCLNDIVTFRVPVELTDQGAHNQKVIVYRHPDVCPPLHIDQAIAPAVPTYSWTIWCQNKVVAQGSGPEASCQGVTNKVYTCRFVTQLDRKCAPPATTSWVSRTVAKVELWGVWTNVFLGTNLQLHAKGAPPYYWKSRDPEVAAVDQEGLVTGVATGKTTIMVWDANGCYADVLVKVLDMALVPDVNRDRAIGDDDRDKITEENPYRFWINDDQDLGDISEGDQDNPGAGSEANCHQGWVSGRCDLLDFFPLWLDVKQVVDEMQEGDGVTIKLRQGDVALKAVYTDLIRNKAGRYQIAEVASCGPQFDQKSFEAEVFAILPSDTVLSDSFLSRIRLNQEKGVLLMEGVRKTTAPLRLEVWKSGTLLGRRELALSVDGVEEMYRWINLRSSGGKPSSTGSPKNNPDEAGNDLNVFFLHGFNVTAHESRGWNAEIFKRLYWSGSRAKFWGMTWDGDVGLINALHYQKNVANALAVAAQFNDRVSDVGGTKIVLAHSLGNMVVSGAIQDYGLSVSKYFMLNAAVATESYHPASFNDAPANYMLHGDWTGYSNKTWCAKWFELFSPPDDRARLTWKNRFPSVLAVAYNFYSSGDEIFDIYPGTPATFSGGLFHLERHAWQKQEVFKGRGGLGGTDWAGWGFEGYCVGDDWVPEYTMAKANAASCDTLRNNAVFDHKPTIMFSSTITTQHQNDIIAQGVPALSYAAGLGSIFPLGIEKNYNANDHKRNGWGRRGGRYNGQWLHCDLKNMAYFYTHELYNQIISQGDLQ